MFYGLTDLLTYLWTDHFLTKEVFAYISPTVDLVVIYTRKMKQNEKQLGDRWRTEIYFPCSLDVPTQTTVEDGLIRWIRIRNEGLVTDGHGHRPLAGELFTARENIVAASESASCHVETIVATNHTRPAVISVVGNVVNWLTF